MHTLSYGCQEGSATKVATYNPAYAAVYHNQAATKLRLVAATLHQGGWQYRIVAAATLYYGSCQCRKVAAASQQPYACLFMTHMIKLILDT